MYKKYLEYLGKFSLWFTHIFGFLNKISHTEPIKVDQSCIFMKFHNIFYYTVQILFVKTVNFQKVVRYKHEISLRKDVKPNQKVELVSYNREFVVTVIVITEFDCTTK